MILSKSRSWGTNILLILLSTTIFVVSFEIFLRVYAKYFKTVISYIFQVFPLPSQYDRVVENSVLCHWRLLDEFEKLSGIPVVLNTSFNVSGEPIVMTPRDAIRCFLGTGIDVLAMRNYLIKKSVR